MTPSSSTLFFLILLTVLIQTYPSHAQICYDTTGNFTPRSAYAKNRDAILSSLSMKVAANDGFYATRMGEDPDTVYAIAYCRGDMSADSCAICVKSAVEDLVVKCPDQKAAFSWGTGEPPCFIRYSNTSIFGILQTDLVWDIYNTANITIDHAIWWNLALGIVNETADGSSKCKFAVGQADTLDNHTIYSLLQCSPDLSTKDCRTCLFAAMDEYDNCCRGHQGGAVVMPSCFFRWDLYLFYTLSANPPSLCLPPPSMPALGGNIVKGMLHLSSWTK